MKKLHLFSVLFLIVCISYGQIDTLQLQDFNGFRVAATELQINNDTVKSINPAPGQVMSFDGQKYINGDETDPKYLTDSFYVKTGIRSWNGSLAKKITT